MKNTTDEAFSINVAFQVFLKVSHVKIMQLSSIAQQTYIIYVVYKVACDVNMKIELVQARIVDDMQQNQQTFMVWWSVQSLFFVCGVYNTCTALLHGVILRGSGSDDCR